MKTFIINSDKELEKYKDDYGYHIEGNAEFNYSADFQGRLFVDGYLSIKAGWSIEAWGSIKAGGSIEAGESYGMSAGLSITAKGTISFGLKAFAGICTWRTITDDEKTITCSKLIGGGVVEYGILVETGEPELDDKTREAMEVLKKAGYKIVKEELLK